ncbi:MAG: D-fructose 1,6-bisphosphatase [Candidatus Bathyarchaeota archaeon]|nr:D-fructose 1,6-bisphosphatase [Candidatus Bathyarchaeota archaeon]
MSTEPNWFKILKQCQTNVHTAIQPHLTPNQPLPNLGRGAGGDPMKPVDLAAETAIVDALQENGVSFSLISEESGFKSFGDCPENCFVTVDPVDGTTNLTHGLPFYATSIAISKTPQLGDVYAGMVSDLSRNLTYIAQKGMGAYFEDKKIQTSQQSSLGDAVVGMDLNTYKIRQIAPKLIGLIEKSKHLRHFGANALEICYVAHGLTDAFVDIRAKIRTTDVAAGFLIVKEAGGLVTAPDGKEVNVKLDPLQTLDFVASGNLQIHKEILGLVAP